MGEGYPLKKSESTTFWEKLASLGSYTTTKTWWEPTSFTGTVNFYEVWYHPNYNRNIDDQHKFSTGWVEYKAVFHLGFLTTIELVSVDEPIEYTEEHIQENEIKFKLQRQELENRCRENREKYPSPEQKLIDSISDIVNGNEKIFDEDCLVAKLNSIQDLISEYSAKFDTWKTTKNDTHK